MQKSYFKMAILTKKLISFANLAWINSVSFAKVLPGFTRVQDRAGGRFFGKSSLRLTDEAYFPKKSCTQHIPDL